VDLVKAAEERLKCAPLVMVQDLGQR